MSKIVVFKGAEQFLRVNTSMSSSLDNSFVRETGHWPNVANYKNERLNKN